MPTRALPAVAVVIPAKDAGETIGRAVRSALAQPEAAEVVVVDDGSSDGTADVARNCDDGTGRLQVIGQANAGPSAAVNRGQEATASPWFCVLDADDYFLAGRLAGIFETLGSDWDLAADRPVLDKGEGRYGAWGGRLPASGELSFAAFVEGNISRVLRPRTELGFLQPVFRRGFFEDLGLRHNEAVRLGEDYLFYAEALGRGARFKVAPTARYAIVDRPGSLSHRHGIADLEALLEADRALTDLPGLDARDREVLARHIAHIENRVHHRRALAAKANGEVGLAMRHIFSSPRVATHVLSRTVADKLRARRRPAAARGHATPSLAGRDVALG